VALSWHACRTDAAQIALLIQPRGARMMSSIGRISSLKDHDVAEFQRLHALYFDFDAAVQNTALYKYQVCITPHPLS
jgi:hypothetical protein